MNNRLKLVLLLVALALVASVLMEVVSFIK
jgi:hypothetical protein